MSTGNSLLSSTIGKKIAMALSAFFLLIFVTQHMAINLLSIFSEEAFNAVSHFMGYNPLVQKVIQPILVFGLFFHFLMGFALEFKNKNARGPQDYAFKNQKANSTWVSRNMIITGVMISLFLAVHMVDFFFPEMNYKYIKALPEDPNRYYGELKHIFENPIKVGLYILGFIFLGLHLNHGFQSAFQSVGANHRKYTPIIKTVGTVYSILVPIVFTIIALFHFINS
jgi:succinate dehydrogenase / fumarate reductase, cytochrome b subunit